MATRGLTRPTDVESVEAIWGYADANSFWMGGYVVRLRDGRRFLADEPYHSLTPLQPSKHRLYAWEEAPAVSNRGIRQRLQVAYYLNLY